MGVKEFFKPTKKKIALLVIILIFGLLSHGFKIGSFGRPLTSTEKFMNNIPVVISPGISALLGDNGFFMNYKPWGTFDMILEGIFHIGIDVILWYLLSCVILHLIVKRKENVSSV